MAGRCARAVLLAGAAAVATTAITDSADARYDRRFSPRRPPAKHAVIAPTIKGPLLIAVSIGSQRLTVYDGGAAVAHAPVSTGMRGHPTPTGVFSVIQKSRYHRSNIYSGAPMPFMQRITWSGVAMHAGALPGYPASHGCIRLPNDFAARLWGMTALGARVIVTRDEVTPVAIEHARLSVLERRPDAVAAGREIRPASADADRPSSAAATAASASAIVAQDPVVKGPAVKTAEIGSGIASDATVPAEAASPSTVQPPVAVQDDSVKPAGARGADASPVTPSLDTVDEATSAVDLAIRPAPRTEVPESPTDPGSMDAAMPIEEVFLPPERPLRPLRKGAISIFISRKDARLYVRKRFDPLFSVPVAIARPEQAIGTHVFTAVEAADGGAGLRWVAVTLPAESRKAEPTEPRGRKSTRRDRRPSPAVDAASGAGPPSSAEALDRLDLPAAVTAQISALMSPGASLIVSDHGLGHETGIETDFIVLTR